MSKYAQRFNENVFTRTFLVLMFITVTIILGMLLKFTNLLIFNWGLLVVFFMLSMGLFFLGVAIFGSTGYATHVAEKTGNHEVLIILLIITAVIVHYWVELLTRMQNND